MGHIELSTFSHCKEMTQKQAKKTTNAFVLCRPDAAANEVVSECGVVKRTGRGLCCSSFQILGRFIDAMCHGFSGKPSSQLTGFNLIYFSIHFTKT